MAYILIDVRGLGSHSGTSNARSAQEATASLEPPTRPDTDTTATSSHSGSSQSSSHTSSDPLLYTTTTGQSVSEQAASSNYTADLYPFLHTSTLQQSNVVTTTAPATNSNSHTGERQTSGSVHSGTNTGSGTATNTDENYVNEAFEAALREQQATQEAEARYNTTAAATTDPGKGKKWPWIVAAIGAAGLLGYAIFGGKKKKDK